MSKSKRFTIVASACLWLALSGSALAGAALGVDVGNPCEEIGHVVRLLQSPSSGLKQISSGVSNANAGIAEISSNLDGRFTDVDEALRLVLESSRPFDLSIVVDEQVCASGATQCLCDLSPGAGPGPISSSGGSPTFGGGTPSGFDSDHQRSDVKVAAALNFVPVAVSILVSRNGVPMIGLGSGAFEFSLGFAPFGGPSVSSGCGTSSFQDAGNGIYQLWLWPQEIGWVSGTYVGRLDVTDDDGFTVNALVPIRIQ